MSRVSPRVAIRLAILLFPCVAAAAAPPEAAWTAVSAGAEHLHLTEGDIDLFRFDLTRFQAEVVVSGRDTPRTASVLRKERRGVLAINGGFFDTEARPLGLRISSARTVVPLRPRVDWGVLLLRPGAASIVHSREYRPDPGVTDAIQVGPRLLIDGHPPGLKPQLARRTAVAIDREGRRLTVVVARAPVEADALARTLERLGFDRALMLDGGPSTQLSADLGDLHLEIPGGYPVPDGLVVKARPAR